MPEIPDRWQIVCACAAVVAFVVLYHALPTRETQ